MSFQNRIQLITSVLVSSLYNFFMKLQFIYSTPQTCSKAVQILAQVSAADNG